MRQKYKINEEVKYNMISLEIGSPRILTLFGKIVGYREQGYYGTKERYRIENDCGYIDFVPEHRIKRSKCYYY